MPRKSLLRCAAGAALLALAVVTEAAPLRIEGLTLDQKGTPLPFVRINIQGANSAPYTTSVFSSTDGRFTALLRDADPAKIKLESMRIGWQETSRENTSDSGTLHVKLSLQPIANVAAQVPASAWIPGAPGDRDFHILINECTQCHQLGAARVKRFASTMAGQPLEMRRAAWDAIVQFMRGQALRMGPEGGQAHLRWGLTEESPEYKAAVTPATSFFQPRDMERVVPFLAKNFPTHFDTYTDFNDIKRLGEYGVTDKTVIEEFVLPSFGWTREVSIAPGSSRVWFVELDGDRLGALDPTSGKVEWFKVPGHGAQGPHTLNADANGNLWMALEESYSLARFNPKTHAWRIYPPPPGVKFAVTHDTAINSKRQVQMDAHGRVWMTLIGINELWSVDTNTAEVKRYPMPLPEGEALFHAFIYGAAMDPSLKRVWWTQLHGALGSFNVETNKVETVVPFPRGAAPRRMAIEDDGTLWVPLYGEGQLLKFDTQHGVEIARYDLPDRAAASYSVTLDSKRHAVWVGTTSSDRIYRFDIDTARWRQYPLPRKEAFLRMLEIDHATGDLWTTYANLPIGRRDPAVYGDEHANNMIVHIHPGD